MGKTIRFKVSSTKNSSAMRKYKRKHNRNRRRMLRKELNKKCEECIEPKNTFDEWGSPRDGLRWLSPELCAKIKKNYDLENPQFLNDHSAKMLRNRLLQKMR